MAVLARRLILGRGGGSIISPASLALTLADAPAGGGVVSVDPKSYYYNGRTFFSYVKGTTGATGLAYYDHATLLASATNDIADLGTPDTHDLPSFIVRDSDKRILAAYSRHGGSSMFIRVSLDPDETLGAWPAATNIDSQIGGTQYYAPSLVQLRGVTNDPIYLFWHDRVSSVERVRYSVSTDGGATWSAFTQLFTGGNFFVGFRVGSDWNTRLDVIAMDDDPYTQPTSIFHMYLDGAAGTWHEADGSALTLPLTPSSLTAVHDGTGGAAFPQGVMLDSVGNPAIVYLVNTGASTNAAKRARWNGSSWDVETIATVGLHPADRFSTGLSIAFDDPDVVFLGDLVSGTVENFRYERIGGVWTPRQITSGSPNDNAQIQSVTFGSALEATWFQGSLVTSTNFNMKTMGWWSP